MQQIGIEMLRQHWNSFIRSLNLSPYQSC